jgi:hypothetical protein
MFPTKEAWLATTADLALPPTPPCHHSRAWGWALYPLANQSFCLIVCTSRPMRSDGVRRFTLPSSLSPYLPRDCWWDIAQATQLQLLCEIFWLQDYRDVTWTRQKREMVRGRLGICNAGWREFWIQKLPWFWALSLPKSAPWSCSWGLRFVATWRVVVGLKLWTPSFVPVRRLHPIRHPAGSFCLPIPIQQTEVAGDSHEFLWKLFRDRALLCSVPITPYWDLASL